VHVDSIVERTPFTSSQPGCTRTTSPSQFLTGQTGLSQTVSSTPCLSASQPLSVPRSAEGPILDPVAVVPLSRWDVEVGESLSTAMHMCRKSTEARFGAFLPRAELFDAEV
jgi:hypothetical protein